MTIFFFFKSSFQSLNYLEQIPKSVEYFQSFWDNFNIKAL